MELVHDTPSNSLKEVPGLGLDITDQLVPFHDSTSVPLVDSLFEDSPVAMHRFEATHDTAVNSSSVDPGLGVVLIDHAVPFHDSTSVWLTSPLSSAPAAKQLTVLVQDIPWKKASLPTLGLEDTAQVLPFHISTNVSSADPLK
jgi:hypothetical protein